MTRYYLRALSNGEWVVVEVDSFIVQAERFASREDAQMWILLHGEEWTFEAAVRGRGDGADR